jgi:hypothetical protein
MNPKNFDELTKELAKSTSRRHALKTILTASVGGVVGLGVIRSVFGSNAFCDRWCHAVFGESRAAGKCTSDAAHHTGLCVTCGDVAPADICCARNSDGFCVGGTVVATCACDSSQCQTCDTSSGTCVGCPPGQTCQNGQCGCSDPGTCGSYQFGCDGDPTCACATNSEGGGTCAGDATCSNATHCTTSADCPANSVCIVGSCCGTPVCLPLCGTEGAAGHRAPTGTGPTAFTR